MDAAERIRGYIERELVMDPTRQITDDTPLLDGLLDSGDLVHLLAFLEESFSVTVDTSELSGETFGTVRDIERLVASKMQASPRRLV